MYKYLLDIIKKIEGNIIGVGLDSILLDGFDKNNRVNVYTIDRAKAGITSSKSKKRTTSSGRTINIKKLYKYFKKDSIDYIIGDIDGDYTVNSKDALIVLRASVGLERLNNTQLILADVDNSKSITSSDSLDILRYSVRLKDIHSIINTPIYLDDINPRI